jgi:hypothetical protein
MEYSRSAVEHMDLAIKVWVCRGGDIKVSIAVRMELMVQEMSDEIRKCRLTEFMGKRSCSMFAYYCLVEVRHQLQDNSDHEYILGVLASRTNASTVGPGTGPASSSTSSWLGSRLPESIELPSV